MSDFGTRYQPAPKRSAESQDVRCVSWQKALLCLDLQHLGCAEGFGVFDKHRRLQAHFREHGFEVIRSRIQSLTADGRDRSPGHGGSDRLPAGSGVVRSASLKHDFGEFDQISDVDCNNTPVRKRKTMIAPRIKSFVFCIVSVAVVTLGFVPVANAGVVTTAETITASDRDARIDDITSLLARADVAEQLVAYGVDPADVSSRLAGLSDNEITLLHENIETQIAGGDALAIIGGVFLILLILELVGVIDIFKGT